MPTVDSSGRSACYHLMLFHECNSQPFQETFGDTKENVYKEFIMGQKVKVSIYWNNITIQGTVLMMVMM